MWDRFASLMAGMLLAALPLSCSGCSGTPRSPVPPPPTTLTTSPPPCVGLPACQTPQEAFMRLVCQRMGELMAIHDVSFDEAYRPQVRFETPTRLHPMVSAATFIAHYELDTREFAFKPDHLTKAPSLSVETIDHELGHVLAHAASLRQGLGMFPPEGYSTMGINRIIGYELVSEGIGTYFEKTTALYKTASDFFLPEDPKDPCWSDDATKRISVVYQGGYWVVEPIIRLHRQRGLDYLVRTPLLIGEDRNIRAAARRYREDALIALALPPPTIRPPGPLTPPESLPGIEVFSR